MEIRWKEPMTTGWEETEKRRQTKTGNYADPTPEMLTDPLWNAIYNEIQDWDINVPSEYAGYSSATGNHATAIFNAIRSLAHLGPEGGRQVSASRAQGEKEDEDQ